MSECASLFDELAEFYAANPQDAIAAAEIATLRWRIAELESEVAMYQAKLPRMKHLNMSRKEALFRLNQGLKYSERDRAVRFLARLIEKGWITNPAAVLVEYPDILDLLKKKIPARVAQEVEADA